MSEVCRLIVLCRLMVTSLGRFARKRDHGMIPMIVQESVMIIDEACVATSPEP